MRTAAPPGPGASACIEALACKACPSPAAFKLLWPRLVSTILLAAGLLLTYLLSKLDPSAFTASLGVDSALSSGQLLAAQLAGLARAPARALRGLTRRFFPRRRHRGRRGRADKSAADDASDVDEARPHINFVPFSFPPRSNTSLASASLLNKRPWESGRCTVVYSVDELIAYGGPEDACLMYTGLKGVEHEDPPWLRRVTRAGGAGLAPREWRNALFSQYSDAGAAAVAADADADADSRPENPMRPGPGPAKANASEATARCVFDIEYFDGWNINHYFTFHFPKLWHYLELRAALQARRNKTRGASSRLHLHAGAGALGNGSLARALPSAAAPAPPIAGTRPCDKIYLLVRTPYEPFVFESFAALGLTQEDYVNADSPALRGVQVIYIGAKLSFSFNYVTDLGFMMYEHLRRSLRVGAPPAPGRPRGRQLLLTRKDAGIGRGRVAVNLEPLQRTLLRAGFELITMSDLTLRARVDAFAEAAVVVVQYGATLTNMLFMPPGLKVLAFCGPDFCLPWYGEWLQHYNLTTVLCQKSAFVEPTKCVSPDHPNCPFTLDVPYCLDVFARNHPGMPREVAPAAR